MTGLEFMGKEWDRLDVSSKPAKWESGGGFSSPGIGKRDIDWPSYSATQRHGTTNPTCAECGGRLRGAKKCHCPKPHDHWKPTGKRRNPENEGLPDHQTGGGMASHLSAMHEWHLQWLQEAFRVLQPGGIIKAFSGTRTFHRLAGAMKAAGFRDLRVEAWNYGSGFPKSLNIGKALDKAAGAEREILATVKTQPKFKYAGDGRLQEKWLDKDTKDITAPATEAAKRWDGWGTALKPSWEPVCVGRKPE
jgi:hypothetical protein